MKNVDNVKEFQVKGMKWAVEKLPKYEVVSE